MSLRRFNRPLNQKLWKGAFYRNIIATERVKRDGAEIERRLHATKGWRVSRA